MPERSAVITGTGACVPRRVLSNAELESMVDTSDEWITTRTGIRERRIADEGESLTQYCVDASRNAMQAAGVGPDAIDLIVLATVTPDMPLPATACTVQHELGCKGAAFDLSAGCSGFIYAQSVAKQFLLTGRCRNVLVIGAELLSRFVDWKDRTTCVLFADGAGAAVMSVGDPPRGVLASAMYADGSGFDFICMPGGGVLHPPNRPETLEQHLPFIRMRGNETFKMAVRSMEEVCREVLAEAGLTTQDVAWLVPHQANQRIISAVGQRLGLPQERCFVNIDRYGNTSAASIPIALDEAVRSGAIKRGDIVLMTAFGAGLTWAASVVHW